MPVQEGAAGRCILLPSRTTEFQAQKNKNTLPLPDDEGEIRGCSATQNWKEERKRMKRMADDSLNSKKMERIEEEFAFV